MVSDSFLMEKKDTRNKCNCEHSALPYPLLVSQSDFHMNLILLLRNEQQKPRQIWRGIRHLQIRCCKVFLGFGLRLRSPIRLLLDLSE